MAVKARGSIAIKASVKGLNDLKKASESLENLSEKADFAGKALKLFAGAAAIGAAVKGITALAEAADEYVQVQNQFTGSLEGARKATSGMVGDLELMKAKLKLNTLGVKLSDKQYTSLLGSLTKLSTAMGTTLEKAIADSATAMSRQSKMIADNVGVTLTLAGANKKYADSLDRNVESLSEQEQKLAFTTEFLKQAKLKAEDLADPLETLGSLFRQLGVGMKNAWNQMIAVTSRSELLTAALRNLVTTFKWLATGKFDIKGPSDAKHIKNLQQKQGAARSVISTIEERLEGAARAGQFGKFGDKPGVGFSVRDQNEVAKQKKIIEITTIALAEAQDKMQDKLNAGSKLKAVADRKFKEQQDAISADKKAKAAEKAARKAAAAARKVAMAKEAAEKKLLRIREEFAKQLRKEEDDRINAERGTKLFGADGPSDRARARAKSSPIDRDEVFGTLKAKRGKGGKFLGSQVLGSRLDEQIADAASITDPVAKAAAVAKINKEMIMLKNTIGSMAPVIDVGAFAFESFSQGLAGSIAAAVDGTSSFEEAMQAMLKATLSSLGQMGVVNAIAELAKAFGSLFGVPGKAAGHFKSAALWGVVATLGFAGSSAISSGDSKGKGKGSKGIGTGGGSGSSSPSIRRKQKDTEINISLRLDKSDPASARIAERELLAKLEKGGLQV